MAPVTTPLISKMFDPKFSTSRELCIPSAACVLKPSTSLESLSRPGWPHFLLVVYDGKNKLLC